MRKTAVITGATDGFGLEFTKIFSRQGYDLLISARSEKKLLTIKRQLEAHYGNTVNVFAADLSQPGAAQALVDYSRAQDLQVECLVNNAGFGDYGRFAETELERQTQMIDVNVRALTELTHLFLQPMLAQGKGRILNIASIAAFEPGPMMSVYYATKAFVLSLTEALSMELKGTGVTATALCPGPTETGFGKTAGMPGARFADRFRWLDAGDVARIGYKAMMKGRTVVVPGSTNLAASVAVRVLPKGLTRRAVYFMQKE